MIQKEKYRFQQQWYDKVENDEQVRNDSRTRVLKYMETEYRSREHVTSHEGNAHETGSFRVKLGHEMVLRTPKHNVQFISDKHKNNRLQLRIVQ
jgi:hypothetical protein